MSVLTNYFQLDHIPRRDALAALEKGEKAGYPPPGTKAPRYYYPDTAGLLRAKCLIGMRYNRDVLAFEFNCITPKGLNLLTFIRQKKKPLTTAANHVPSKVKNDICLVCSLPVFMPAHAVRCEYGGCIFDMSSANGDALILEWDEELHDYILTDPSSTTPVFWREPVHVCDCIGLDHTHPLTYLVANVGKAPLKEAPKFVLKQRV